VDYLSKPGLVQEGSTKRSNIRLFALATYATKDRVFARMKIPRPGPGYMHLPDWVTDKYLEQLTGEKKITVRDTPAIYRELGKLAEAVRHGQSPEPLTARGRRMRSNGII
jgi:hypothetical protein